MSAIFKPGLIIKRDIARLRSPAFSVSGRDSTMGVGVRFPEHHDMRPQMLNSPDQGVTPECAAYAMADWIGWWNWRKTGLKLVTQPDPIYAQAKKTDGIPDDEGTTLEAVVNAAVSLGLAKIDLSSLKVVSLPDVKNALHRHSVMLSGFTVTEGWRWARGDGWIKSGTVAGANYDEVLGGHAVVLIGYSDVDTPPWFAVQNSWGEDGYGWRGDVRMTPQQFNDQFTYGLVWEMKP